MKFYYTLKLSQKFFEILIYFNSWNDFMIIGMSEAAFVAEKLAGRITSRADKASFNLQQIRGTFNFKIFENRLHLLTRLFEWLEGHYWLNTPINRSLGVQYWFTLAEINKH